MNRYLSLSLVATALWACVHATGWTAAPTEFDPNAPDILAIKQRLLSGNTQQVERAVASIRVFFASKPEDACIELQRSWGALLMISHRYEDAAAFGSLGALQQVGGGYGYLEYFLSMRARALLKLGRCGEALETAKSFYNVCRMESTSRAVDLVSEALTCARKADPGIGEKFRTEQVAAVSTNAPPAGASKDPSILASVKVNGEPYKPAIEKLLAAETLSPQALLSLGDIYLMADLPDKAEQMFQEAYAQAGMANAAEGIARAIRAQDGNARRANAWILEQRTKK